MSLILVLIACSAQDTSQDTIQEKTTQPSIDMEQQSVILLSDITKGDLVISEIMHDPIEIPDWRGEWIEIYNAHTKSINLNGLSVESGGSSEIGFTINSELIIEPDGYVVLANTENSVINGGNTEVDFQYKYTSFKLLGAASILLSYNGTVLDTVSYDKSFPLIAGRSLMNRSLNATNNDSVDDWCYSFSIYGTNNAGTPGAKNDRCLGGDALSTGDLVITEIMSDPNAVADWRGEWFEIQNSSNAMINLKNLTIIGGPPSSLGRVTINENYFIEPNAYFVFGTKSAENGGYTPDYLYPYNDMKLIKEGSISLSSNGTEIDTVQWDSSWTMSVGASFNLSSSFADSTLNDDVKHWCNSTKSYGDGDLGSPGAMNVDCGGTANNDGTLPSDH